MTILASSGEIYLWQSTLNKSKRFLRVFHKPCMARIDVVNGHELDLNRCRSCGKEFRRRHLPYFDLEKSAFAVDIAAWASVWLEVPMAQMEVSIEWAH